MLVLWERFSAFLLLLLLANKSVWNDTDLYLCAASNITIGNIIGCSLSPPRNLDFLNEVFYWQPRLLRQGMRVVLSEDC